MDQPDKLASAHDASPTESVLDVAHRHAVSWLASLDERRVPPTASVDEVGLALGAALPDGPSDPVEVVELLARAAQPGLTAMPSGRFFGFVIGGTHPVGVAADWLVSAWDQNSGLRVVTPAVSAVEDVAGAWLLDLLGLPGDAAVGFTTGATMANFTALAAARDEVLRRHGWDVAANGLAGGPRVRVVVGAERHDTVDLALRMLGLGQPDVVGVDDQGRLRADELRTTLEWHRQRGPDGSGPVLDPTIVCLQAGNIHSGAFDPLSDAIAVAHEVGAWVHVDGAFGLWAGASPRTRRLVAGIGDADSWATDAHKTLSTPYDCGIVVVRDAVALRRAMGVHGAYLVHDDRGEPSDKVPELSRRARALPVWAVLRSLGRSGVAALVDRLCAHARAFADGLAALPGVTVENEVVFTQVCASFGSDERTREVVRWLLDDGVTWMTGSTWRGRAVLRISVSNWATTERDVARSLDSVQRAVRALAHE